MVFTIRDTAVKKRCRYCFNKASPKQGEIQFQLKIIIHGLGRSPARPDRPLRLARKSTTLGLDLAPNCSCDRTSSRFSAGSLLVAMTLTIKHPVPTKNNPQAPASNISDSPISSFTCHTDRNTNAPQLMPTTQQAPLNQNTDRTRRSALSSQLKSTPSFLVSTTDKRSLEFLKDSRLAQIESFDGQRLAMCHRDSKIPKLSEAPPIYNLEHSQLRLIVVVSPET
jgi:hypothetical protein